MIPVRCAHCGLQIQVPATVQGRVGLCFGCGARLRVPIQNGLPQDQELAFRPGDPISDRYVIQDKLGSGGMGVVYHARDTLIDEEVALKFMRPRLLRTQKGQKLFIQEAQVARRLRHEHIVAVHDVGATEEGILYLSMELLKGRPLRAYLNHHRRIRKLVSVRLAVSVTAQTLAALEYAHRTVIHRDIKPENVMVLPGEHAKVLDFGLAKAVDAETHLLDEATQKSKRIIGTLAYAAPEQRKRWNIDHRADLYAVGLLLYELLTLRTPIDEHIEVPEVRNDVAPSILATLNRALLDERDARWQTAAEFRQALLEAFDTSYRPVEAASVGAQAAGAQAASTEGMAFLEGGSFLMGSNDLPEAAPEFEAHVDPFYMDIAPVTVAQYAAFLDATGAAKPKFWDQEDFNGPTQPVVGVTWNEASAYAAWAGKQLPTEAQWEYAARGRENRRYPWGMLEPDPTRCNFRDYLGMPSIVSMHEEGMTPEGLKDMAGNVFEWTLDPFTPYEALTGGPPPSTPLRVVRGGSWHSPAPELRCVFRKGLFPETQLTTVGFRCVALATGDYELR